MGEDTSVAPVASPHPALNFDAEDSIERSALRATLPVMSKTCFQHEEEGEHYPRARCLTASSVIRSTGTLIVGGEPWLMVSADCSVIFIRSALPLP